MIGKCVEMGVPIFHGRIDRTLFETSLRSLSAARDGRPAHRPGTELDSPQMEGRGTHSKTLADLLPRAAELYGDRPAVRYKDGESWVDRSFNQVRGDRPAAGARPDRSSGSRRATGSRSSATPARSGPTSTSRRSRSAPPWSRSTRPTRRRSAATCSRTPTPRSSSSRTTNSCRRSARSAPSCRSWSRSC